MIRVLWGGCGRSLTASSFNENASFNDDEILSSTRRIRERTNDYCPCHQKVTITKEENDKPSCESEHREDLEDVKSENEECGCSCHHANVKPTSRKDENQCGKHIDESCYKSEYNQKNHEDVGYDESIVEELGCPCHQNVIQEVEEDDNECDKNSEIPKTNDDIECLSTQKEFREIGIMTDGSGENSCKREIIVKNVATSTDDIDDSMELTNIYINEISLCYCNSNDETKKNVGINTECIKEDNKCVMNIGTNTECQGVKDNSTQAFFKEIQFCTCYKNIDEEFVIENISFDKEDYEFSCQCNKETSTDEKFTLLELEDNIPKEYTCPNDAPFDDLIEKLQDSPCANSEFTGFMKSKISEIVNLNEKIRQKCRNIKGNKDLCSVSVQTIRKTKSHDTVSVQIQVKTSLVSLRSSASKNTSSEKSLACSNPSALKQSQKCIKVRSDSLCQSKHLQNPSSTLKRSILTEVAAIRENPVLQKFNNSNLNICHLIQESHSHSFCNLGGGDASEFHYYESRSNVQRTCRCSRKSIFLNFLSEHLTRETFEKCKKILRSVLQKLLEKGRTLNDLRKSLGKSRCRCKYCRLDGGGSREYGKRELTRAAGNSKNGRRRKRRSRGLLYRGESEERCRRIEAFAAKWRRKPCDIYEASSGSLPLSRNARENW